MMIRQGSGSLDQLAKWLRCPNCRQALVPTAELTIGCAAGHRFDVNKRGYVTLVGTSGTRAGDTLAMVNDRAALLDSGAYSPIAEALERKLPSPAPVRVLDAGGGTGYYLERVLGILPGARGLALDRSPAAVRVATRAGDRVSGLVADTWEPLPVRDAACDLILNVFAPRNPDEFSRVLSRAGSILIVVPRQDHLRELREAAQMLSVPSGKSERVREQLGPRFVLEDDETIRYPLTLRDGQAQLLREMGPSAHHPHERAYEAPPVVTVSVDVLRFRRR